MRAGGAAHSAHGMRAQQQLLIAQGLEVSTEEGLEHRLGVGARIHGGGPRLVDELTRHLGSSNYILDACPHLTALVGRILECE